MPDLSRYRDYARERLHEALADLDDESALYDTELAAMALAVYHGAAAAITLDTADVREIVDSPEPVCICPPGLVERGGFRSSCPVHGGRL